MKINGSPFSKIKQTMMSWHKNIRPTANTLGRLHFFSSSAIAGIEIYTNMMAKVAGYMYSLSDMATNIRKAISILTNIVKSKDCLEWGLCISDSVVLKLLCGLLPFKSTFQHGLFLIYLWVLSDCVVQKRRSV